MNKLAIAITLFMLIPTTIHAAVIWRGDFETGDISQWSWPHEAAPDRVTATNNPVAQGCYAGRFHVEVGDIASNGNRAELVKVPDVTEGQEFYFRWYTYFPDDYVIENTWQILVQWHQRTDIGVSPPLMVSTNGPYLILGHADEDSHSIALWKTPIVKNVWHQFILHVIFSSNPSIGLVQLWYDGQQATSPINLATLLSDQSSYLKQGLYRSQKIMVPSTVFHDGMIQATTLEEVLAADNNSCNSEPVAPNYLTTNNIGTSEIDLLWNDNSSNEDGFEIERCQEAGCTNFVQIAETSANMVSYNDLTLSPSTTYVYRIRAFNAIGISEYSNSITVTTKPALVVISAPANLAFNNVTKTSINLVWSDASRNEEGFLIERCIGVACVDFVQIAQTNSNIVSYNDVNLSPATTHLYRVRAFNSFGTSEYSNSIMATTKSVPVAPFAPANLAFNNVTKTSINLVWSDASRNEEGFLIERCIGVACVDFVQIAQTNSNIVSYNDMNLSPATTHVYRVRAFNSVGTSEYSNSIMATTKPVLLAPLIH